MDTKAVSGLTIGLGVAFLAILLLLHVLEPEFNPPHVISEYQLGRFWLVDVTCLRLPGSGFARSLSSGEATNSYKSGTRLGLGVTYHRRRLFRGGHLPSRSKMVSWQLASRHRGTGRHLRLAHRVHICE